jgi:hypothetical protein
MKIFPQSLSLLDLPRIFVSKFSNVQNFGENVEVWSPPESAINSLKELNLDEAVIFSKINMVFSIINLNSLRYSNWKRIGHNPVQPANVQLSSIYIYVASVCVCHIY